MKKIASLALAIATLAPAPHASAQPTIVAPGFGLAPFHTHTNGDAIVSFDWDAAANLYYMTTAGFPDISVWRTSGGAPTSIYANANRFSGASVVFIGDFVYFNDSDFSNTQFVHRYGPVSGAAVSSQISTTRNSSLYGHDGDLFIAGAPGFGTNQIYHSDLAVDGTLVNDPATSLGVTSGSSGPLVFDGAGNLYYAPGFGDLSIYKWSALEVGNAIASPAGSPLNTPGHLWLNYSALYPTASGATSMLLDADGDLLVTLSNFIDPSGLVEFGADAGGDYDGTALEILTDTGRLGELRTLNGGVFVSSDNKIFQLVPEPGCALVVVGFAVLLARRSRKC